jgi:hypothetical protein
MTLRSLADRRGFPVFAGLGAFLFLISFVMRAETHLWGLLGPHEYWASQWATDYSNGFVHRGLLGQLLGLIGLDDASYGLLTILAWATTCALYLLIVHMLWRLCRTWEWRPGVLFAVGVLLSPAISGILIETTGDPLQLLLLVHLLLTRLVIERPMHPALAGAICALAYASMVLVHEASFFLIAPWLIAQGLIIRRTPQAVTGMLAGVISGTLVAGFIVLHGLSGVETTPPTLHFGGSTFVYEGRLAPPFRTLLDEETHRMFGSGLAGLLETVQRIAGAVLVPGIIAGLLIFLRTGVGKAAGKARRAHLLTLLTVLACLAPLMVIAHDWGRFLSYELVLFMGALVGWPASDPAPETGKLAGMPIAGLLVLSGVCDTGLLNAYRMDGLDANRHMFTLALLIVALFACLTFLDVRRDHGPQPEA